MVKSATDPPPIAQCAPVAAARARDQTRRLSGFGVRQRGRAGHQKQALLFGAFEYVSHDLSTAVTATPANIAAVGLPADFGNPVPTVERPYFFLGKMDYQINAKNTLAVRYNHFRNEQPFNNGGGLTVKSQTILFRDRVHALGAQLIRRQRPHRQRIPLQPAVPRSAERPVRNRPAPARR